MKPLGSVLIVDRDSELVSILSSFLSLRGYRVVFTTRVREALKRLANQRFEHIFIDPILDPDNTSELFSDLMTVGTLNFKTPLTLMTFDLEYALPIPTAKRMHSILPKPFSLPELALQIHEATNAQKTA